MKIRHKAEIGLQLVKSKFFRLYSPLITSWEITTQCNKNCSYCTISRKGEFMDYSKCTEIIENLRKRGTKVISFTGGEPTMHPEITKILALAKNKIPYIILTTNGYQLKKGMFQYIDQVILSLDGPEKTNDNIRGAGSFDTTIKAIKLCQKNQKKCALNCVLSDSNKDYVKETLKIAKSMEVGIVFQPIFGKDNQIKDLKAYRRNIKYLLREKAKGNMHLLNSTKVLNEYYNYPKKVSANCISGKVYLRLNPLGEVKSCGFFPSKNKKVTGLGTNRELFRSVNVVGCKECICNNLLTLSYVYELNLKVIWDLFRRI